MFDIVKYVSLKGWVMKFLPHPAKIIVDFMVVEKGIEFRETGQSYEIVTDKDLEIFIWKSINRLERNIKLKLNAE